MDTYEIRVLTRDYETSRICVTVQASVFAAIRRAQATAQGGEGVEVWRGLDCIYANYREQEFSAR